MDYKSLIHLHFDALFDGVSRYAMMLVEYKENRLKYKVNFKSKRWYFKDSYIMVALENELTRQS
jgi:hypothetical protein